MHHSRAGESDSTIEDQPGLSCSNKHNDEGVGPLARGQTMTGEILNRA